MEKSEAPDGWWCDAPKPRAVTRYQRKKQGRASRRQFPVQGQSKRLKICETTGAKAKVPLSKTKMKAAKLGEGDRRQGYQENVEAEDLDGKQPVDQTMSEAKEDEEMMEILYGSIPEVQGQTTHSGANSKRDPVREPRASQKGQMKKTGVLPNGLHRKSRKRVGAKAGVRGTVKICQESGVNPKSREVAPPTASQQQQMNVTSQSRCAARNHQDNQVLGAFHWSPLIEMVSAKPKR